jgi:hypothetical protein
VAHMGGIVDGGAAVVPCHAFAAALRHKRLLPAGTGKLFLKDSGICKPYGILK